MAGLDVDAAIPLRIANHQRPVEAEVDAVGLAGETHHAVLLALFPVLQRLDVARALQALDAYLADVADGEVGVQRLADRQRLVAEVAGGQFQLQVLAEAHRQAQLGGMRPAGQAVVGVEAEVHGEFALFVGDVFQFPVDAAHQPVGRAALAFDHAAHFHRVALQAAEPRPAHRHAAAHGLAVLVLGGFAEPHQRLLLVGLVAEQLRALLGDQRLAMGGMDAPAGQLVDAHLLDAGSLDFGAHGGLRDSFWKP
ncbi:hypothetical protein D3C76_1009930 [compost metagenome]